MHKEEKQTLSITNCKPWPSPKLLLLQSSSHLLFFISLKLSIRLTQAKELVIQNHQLTVEVHARPGADYRRGQTCATGHVVPAAPAAIVFLQALQATLRSALATPI